MAGRNSRTIRADIVRTVVVWKRSDDRASVHGETGDGDDAQFNDAMEECERLVTHLLELVDELHEATKV